MVSRQLLGLTAGARLLILVAMGAPILWTHDLSALLALAVVSVVWFVGQIGSESPRLSRWIDPTVEAALIGVVCGIAVHSSLAILAALSLAPFLGGLRRSVLGVILATSAQLVGVVLIGFLRFDGLTADQGLGVFTWSVAGVGLGFIATFVRATALQDLGEVGPYLEAQKLIRDLIDISDGLSSGLDVNALAGEVLSTVSDHLPTAAMAIYVPRGDALVPLSTRVSEGERDLSDVESLSAEARARSEPLLSEHSFAFPLGDTAVVGGSLARSAGLAPQEVERTIEQLIRSLRSSAVQLDTALLFSDFRDSATADVRTRLAREMHDGVAQDIASLGYLVDALAARPANEEQGQQLNVLRERLTKIVAEVRQSVSTLRTSIGEAASLGTAIGSVARHLSESSQVPIQVTLDERSARLRSEVEAELFRITQEAMNNAIKHAQCTSIEVHCQVHAPDAHITITDDGRGMQGPRSDSYGLKIMRERARLINGDLTIEPNPAGGLVVSVQIGAAR